MASEDVIELGSSDDEAEPAPKKSKPMPNAMVCIPRKIHEVTIRPSKLNKAKAIPISKGVPALKAVSTVKTTPTRILSKVKEVSALKLPKGVSLVKGISPKELTIAKTPIAKKKTTLIKPPSILSNPFASKTINGKPAHKNVVTMMKPIKIQNSSTSDHFHAKNQASNMNAIINSEITSNKMPISKSLNNLPSSITVKKTSQVTKSQPLIFMKAVSTIMKPHLSSKLVNDVQTVELDDDESAPITSSPAWYIRPEEQTEEMSLEKENNAEPAPPNMIEITIEDSPIKPVLNKRTCEIGAELAITIDDSPVKATVKKNASHSDSDDEASSSKEPHSKKKLEYPKDVENSQTVEIEIDFPYEVSLETNSKEEDKSEEIQEVSADSVQHQEESKKCDDADRSTQKNNSTASKENKIEIPSSSGPSEFHSVYQQFIDTCFQLENSEDMKKIVDKKIKAYYRQVPKEYSESEEFVDMVSSKILAMKASPEKMYLYIKDIVDELNMQRKVVKSQILNMDTKKEEAEQFTFKEDKEYDSKRQRQIRKLEKTIKKLHRAIQKLEEQEVDFDDEDDSVYLLTERYKERMVRVYSKFCQLTNTKMPSEPRIVIDARPGQPTGPAKRLEKWINKKVPIGSPLPFPDFHDVLRCVRDANDEDKLGWNEADIVDEARDLFTRCGKKLQRRRQENEWRLAASRIALEIDPAENNDQLKCKLEANKKIAANKETEIFNKYADRQNQLKLEAIEIGDKEAEESPVESEEEEAERVSLENKGKRKERLKRLIQEISKGISDEKENEPSKEPEVEAETKKSEVNEEKVTIQENCAKSTEIKEMNAKDSENKESDAKSTENNKGSAEILEKSKGYDKDTTETFSLSSDDTNDLESDIDELHLLQKLHSGNEAESSTLESSDSDSLIAISDSIESDSDTNIKQSDVISIENSSYSESEADKVDSIFAESGDTIMPDQQPNNSTESPVDGNDIAIPKGQTSNESEVPAVKSMETDCANILETSNTNDFLNMDSKNSDTKDANSKSNNNEYNKPVEDILLASSDEETVRSQEQGLSSTDSGCINLRDDLISIDETIVGRVVDKPEKGLFEKESSVPEKLSNTDEPIVIENNTKDDHNKKDNKVTENTNESISVESSQEIAPSAPTVGFALHVSDVTKSADTVTNMDVDEVDEELKTNSRVEDNLPRSLSSETK